jgi:uncharacterized membrane protein YGL010W
MQTARAWDRFFQKNFDCSAITKITGMGPFYMRLILICNSIFLHSTHMPSRYPAPRGSPSTAQLGESVPAHGAAMPSSLARSADELMVQYAHYHRDRRNIATHFVGIPLIVFGVSVLLSRPEWLLFGQAVTPILALWVVSSLWYLSRGQWLLGAATSVVNGLLMLIAHNVASGSTASWLAWGIGSFVVGWVFQFVGHHFEGKKPAFVDDLVGLLVGPMFVVGEALMGAGLLPALADQIEREAGATH